MNDVPPPVGTDAAGITPLETLDKSIAQLASHLSAATCRWLLLVAEYDRHPHKGSLGLGSSAHYLNWRCGVSLVAAREHVRVARAIEELPRIRGCFAQGRLSYSKVRAMTRVATPANEDYFIRLATQATAAQVESLAREYRQVRLNEGMDERKAPRRRRRLSYRWDDDGMLVLSGRLPAEEGALVLEALNAAMDAIARDDSAESRATPGSSPDESFRDGAAPTPEKDAANEPDSDTQSPRGHRDTAPEGAPGPYDYTQCEHRHGARRADALVRLAHGYLGGDTAALAGADRYQVVLHLSEDALCRDDEQTRRSLEDGPGVTRETARRMACDCSTVRLTESADGTPLDIGRKTRHISPALRRALKARDRGCRFPGCTTRAQHTDAHHIEHWADGGETKLDNLILVCGHHHALIHDGGFHVRVNDAGKVEFRTPQGALIPDAPAPPRGEASVVAPHGPDEEDSPYLRTSVGEAMDHDLAISALLRKDYVPLTSRPPHFRGSASPQ